MLANKEDTYLTDNVIDFQERRSSGIIGGGSKTPENWLRELSAGTIFLARLKGDQNLLLNKYMVLGHLTMSSNLLWGTPDKNLDIWVPSLEFSRKFELHEIVGNVEAVTEEKQQQVAYEPDQESRNDAGEEPPATAGD